MIVILSQLRFQMRSSFEERKKGQMKIHVSNAKTSKNILSKNVDEKPQDAFIEN